MGKTKVLRFKPLRSKLPPLPDFVPPSDVYAVTCLWELGDGKYRRGWKFRDAVPLDGDGQVILASDADRLIYNGREGGDCSWWVYGIESKEGDPDYRVPDGVVRAVTMWDMAGGVDLWYVTPTGTGPAYNRNDTLMRATWRHFVPDWYGLSEGTAFVVRYLFGWETAAVWKAFAK